MPVGMIGLDRIGSNLTRRLLHAGHACVVRGRQPEVVEQADPAQDVLSAMRHAFGGHDEKAAGHD